MSSLTPELNRLGIEFVREQIRNKTGGLYFANSKSVLNSITDMDHHPYTRWYRGVPYYPAPVIAEREAGWRKREDSCYKVVEPAIREEQPPVCFEAACTTVFPCFQEEESKVKLKVNKNCIVQNY